MISGRWTSRLDQHRRWHNETWHAHSSWCAQCLPQMSKRFNARLLRGAFMCVQPQQQAHCQPPHDFAGASTQRPMSMTRPWKAVGVFFTSWISRLCVDVRHCKIFLVVRATECHRKKSTDFRKSASTFLKHWFKAFRCLNCRCTYNNWELRFWR